MKRGSFLPSYTQRRVSRSAATGLSAGVATADSPASGSRRRRPGGGGREVLRLIQGDPAPEQCRRRPAGTADPRLGGPLGEAGCQCSPLSGICGAWNPGNRRMISPRPPSRPPPPPPLLRAPDPSVPLLKALSAPCFSGVHPCQVVGVGSPGPAAWLILLDLQRPIPSPHSRVVAGTKAKVMF